MVDRAEKQRVMALLRRAGLWEEANQYREQARQRLRDDGKSKQEAVEGAWEAMAEKFLPLAEQATSDTRVVLPDGVETLDDALDPEYAETNPQRQMRDAYKWIQAEFHRIASDTGSVDLRKASTPPPIGIAVSIAQSWAAKPCHKRDGLFREIRVWLGSSIVTSPGDSETETSQYEEEEPYLANL